MLLIGSRALNIITGAPSGALSDWDIIGEPEDLGDYKVEWHSPDHLNNKEILDNYVGETTVYMNGKNFPVVSRKGLAIIKRSHLWRDYKWDKHITHYHRHLTDGVQFDDKDKEILNNRIKLTKKVYPQRNPSLKQTNEDFFDDFVEKKYDHDFIHELAAHYDRPLFERLKRDDSKAWCEKDLWDSLEELDKIKCVKEEAYVIACERYMIPNDWNYIPKLAYMNALKKICTTLTSGWFRDYAIDNYPHLVYGYDHKKIERIKNGLY